MDWNSSLSRKPRELQAGDLIAGRFKLERLAGEGAMGDVYRATDLVDASPVALKILKLDMPHRVVSRFAREADVLSTLSHPALISYVASGALEDGRLFLAMEWLDEGDLEQHLAREERLPLKTSLALARRVAEGLGEAHRCGIIHRDVKPSNLLLVDGQPGQVKLIDFGVALLPEATKLTVTGMAVGTPCYMAPEQAAAERLIDASADVYALGCVLFECLTGRPPFVGQSIVSVLTQIVFEEPPRLNDLLPEGEAVSDGVEALMARFLSKEPSDRPPDGKAAAEELLRVIEGDSDRPRTPTARRPGLSDVEQLVMTALVAAPGAQKSVGREESVRTMAYEELVEWRDVFRRLGEPYGARIESLTGALLIARLPPCGSLAATTRRTAELALAIRAAHPEVPLVLATGRGTVGVARTGTGGGRAPGPPLGRVVDWAVGELGRAGAEEIRLDDVTARLLGGRFDIEVQPGTFRLRSQLSVDEQARRPPELGVPLIGRRRELGELQRVYQWTVAERTASALLAVGTGGVGKSCLVIELVRALQTAGEPVEVMAAYGEPGGEERAYGMLASLLKGWAGVDGAEPMQEQRDRLEARLHRSFGSDPPEGTTGFVARLSALALSDEDDAWLAAARGDPRRMLEQVRSAVEALLRAECATRPVVWVLEDIHWADGPTVQVVEWALRYLRDAPLFVLSTAQSSVRERFPRLWEGCDLTVLRLRPLSTKASGRFVRELSAGGRASVVAALGRLVERGKGNPFLLRELIFAFDPEQSGELPQAALGWIQARLAALEPGARRVLRAAGVFGESFWAGGVSAVVGEDDASISTVPEWLEKLAQLKVVARESPSSLSGEQQYRFVNAEVREAAQAMLTEADRDLGRRLANQWLAQRDTVEAIRPPD